MNKADLLKQQRLHRGDAQGFVLNFLLNFSAHARLMRTFLPPTEEKKDILQAAMRAYTIGMAASLETYFRDLYLCLLERDPNLVQKALDVNGRRESVTAMSGYLADGVSTAEFAATQVSFQSAGAINRNFSVFFETGPFFDVLDRFELVCAIPSVKRPGLAQLKLFPGWQTDLARIFNLRHEFAHDANSKTQLDPHEMRRLETTAIVLCQLTAYSPEITPSVGQDESSVPVILLISDIIADDWEVVAPESDFETKET
jgi:hypothetical protein